MKNPREEILDYWNREDVESMYDKFLLRLEINLIKKYIKPGMKILDAGCGEGEGTVEYADIPGVVVHAADFSDTRLKMAQTRLKNKPNVILKKIDFLDDYQLDRDYDVIVSQRFLINLPSWELQKKVIADLMSMLKVGGRLLMMEGSIEGVRELNDFRKRFGLEQIPIRWHNLFFDDRQLLNFVHAKNFRLIAKDGLGEYFLLTRGIRPLFTRNLAWNSRFNKIAALSVWRTIFRLRERFSRLRLWILSR